MSRTGLKIDYTTLKELRKAKKLKQEYMAAKLNVSTSTYRKYENGDRTPSDVNTIRTLAELLDVDFETLSPTIYNVITTIESNTPNIDFKTPYKYQLWSCPIKTSKGMEEGKPQLIVFFPDGTKKEVDIEEFHQAEKNIQNFIDFTFKNLKGKEVE